MIIGCLLKNIIHQQTKVQSIYHKPIFITSLRDFVGCVFPVIRNILSLTGQYLS